MPPITYQMMQDAYQRAARGSSQPPVLVVSKQLKQFLDSGITADDFDEDIHIPGVECVDNPFCEECYK